MPGRRPSRLPGLAWWAPVLAAVVLAITGLGATRTEASQDQAQLERGRALYFRNCAWCHGNDGTGTPEGPSLIGVGAASTDFVLTTGRMPLERPTDQPPSGPPTFGPDGIASLVAFVDAEFGGGPPIPDVDPARGDLGVGAELYGATCAACHSTSGNGAALTGGERAPSLDRSTARQVAEAVRIGGAGLRTGNMPRFGPDALDDRELDSVVRYTLYLQDPRNPGGQPLRHLGPVAEGFVAIFFALVAAVLLTVWIARS